MFFTYYILFRFFLLGFGVLAIGYGLRGLVMSKAESYNTESLLLNFWGALIALCIGLILTATGIQWVLSFV
jgi:hypothetical protein